MMIFKKMSEAIAYNDKKKIQAQNKGFLLKARSWNSPSVSGPVVLSLLTKLSLEVRKQNFK